MAIGKNIKKAREDRSLTLKQVSERSGVSIGFLGDIEIGRTNPLLKDAAEDSDGIGCFAYRTSWTTQTW